MFSKIVSQERQFCSLYPFTDCYTILPDMAQAIQLGRGYCDLSIPFCGLIGQISTIDLVRRALLLGYETIAINVRVNQKDILSKGKDRHKAKKARTENGQDKDQGILDFPEPPVIELEKSDYPDLASKNKKPVILTRLTLTFSNNDFLPIFNNSKNVDKYDILAINPTSALALQNLLKSNFKADLLAFDPESSSNAGDNIGSGLESTVRWNRKLYNECVEKNMYFELPYAPAIRDSTIRRRIIRQSHIYHAVGKSKNVLISSDANHVLEIRGPHDVANLGHLFGLDEQQGKFSVTTMGANLIRSAAGRKIGPYRATVQRIEDLPESEQWKVPKLGSSLKDLKSDCEESIDIVDKSNQLSSKNNIEDDNSLKIYD